MYYINAYTSKGTRIDTGRFTRSLSMRSAEKKAKYFVDKGKVCEIVFFVNGQKAKVVWRSDEVVLS